MPITSHLNVFNKMKRERHATKVNFNLEKCVSFSTCRDDYYGVFNAAHKILTSATNYTCR